MKPTLGHWTAKAPAQALLVLLLPAIVFVSCGPVGPELLPDEIVPQEITFDPLIGWPDELVGAFLDQSAFLMTSPDGRDVAFWSRAPDGQWVDNGDALPRAVDAAYIALSAGEAPYLITRLPGAQSDFTLHRLVPAPLGAPARLVASIPTEGKSYTGPNLHFGPTGLLLIGTRSNSVDIRFVDPVSDEVHVLMDDGPYHVRQSGGLVDDGTTAHFLILESYAVSSGEQVRQLRAASFALSDPVNTFTLGPAIAVSESTRPEGNGEVFALLNRDRYQVILNDSEGTSSWKQMYAFDRQNLSLDLSRSGRVDDLASSWSAWQESTFDVSRHTAHHIPFALERYIEFDADLQPRSRPFATAFIRTANGGDIGFPYSYTLFGESDNAYFAYTSSGGGHVFEIVKATATIGRTWRVSTRGLDFSIVQRAHLEGETVTVAGFAQITNGGRAGFAGSFSIAE